jgi:folate-dependent phosphoribosylglycinamide formyltransferase PurN
VRDKRVNAGYHCGVSVVKPELLLCAHGLDVMGNVLRGMMQVGASGCKSGASSRVHVRDGGIDFGVLIEEPAVVIHVRDRGGSCEILSTPPAVVIHVCDRGSHSES